MVRRAWGDIMLDGKQYFGSFPDETPQPPKDSPEPGKASFLTPGLRAALEQLDRELRSFLNESQS
jgi:hypothetical protein